MNGKHALTKKENSKHDVNLMVWAKVWYPWSQSKPLRVFANNNCVVTKKDNKKAYINHMVFRTMIP